MTEQSAPEEHPANEHATITGWRVLHLFCTLQGDANGDAIELALKQCQADGHQVVTAALLGHKAELAVMALGPSEERLLQLQQALRRAGCIPNWSYVSLTEISEYARTIPEAMREARLHPVLPPEGMPAFCFYPMSKRRSEDANWYALDYEERLALMHGHGRTGRTFHGRVLQLVTASTGLDDWEWGVTLFGRSLDDLKECVYSMRFDEASARFAEFGPFLTGRLASPSEILAARR
ncbi:MAG: Chlorite dismutase [Acidimicrobiaceae bacterium]|nr:Chlorite dismutase [Acidimicrobiaceae bacterium]